MIAAPSVPAAPTAPTAPTASTGGLLARVLMAVLGFYRTAISPAFPPRCRYVPSCSAYAVEAIQLHGAGRGSWLAARRLLRCHPFHAGGHDPVPLRVCCADDAAATADGDGAADVAAVRAAV